MKKRYIILGLAAVLTAYLHVSSNQPVEGQPFPAAVVAQRRQAMQERLSRARQRADTQASRISTAVRHPEAPVDYGLPTNLDTRAMRDYLGISWDIEDWKIRLNVHMATCLKDQEMHLEFGTNWAVTDTGQLTPLSFYVDRDAAAPTVSDEAVAAFNKCLEPFFFQADAAPYWNAYGEPGSKQRFDTQFYSPVAYTPLYETARNVEVAAEGGSPLAPRYSPGIR